MNPRAELQTIRERAIRATPNGDDKHPGAYLADVFEMYDITRNTVPRLLDAVKKVLELHKRTQHGECATCHNPGPASSYGIPYPCPTVTAITTALEGLTA